MLKIMEKIEFKTQYEQMFVTFDGELNSGEVLVEPEKCLSIREIAERFAQGYDISEFRSGLDEGSELNDDDIDIIDNPQYDAEFDSFYDAVRRSNYIRSVEPSANERSEADDERDTENARGKTPIEKDEKDS